MHAIARRRWTRPGAFLLSSLSLWIVAAGLPFAPAQPSAPGVDVVKVALVGDGAQRSPLSQLSAVASAAVAAAAPTAAPGWSAQVSLPNHGETVGFTWDGTGAGALRVRSHDATGWSDWLDLAGPDAMADPAEGNGKASAGPAWIGRGNDAVEVAVTDGVLPDLTMLAIHSDPGFATASGGAFGAIPSAGAAIGAPGMLYRAQWGAREWNDTGNPDCGATPALGKGVFGEVIHHTVTSNSYGPNDAPSILRGIQAFHMDGNGWCDIGYNFLVDRFGTVYEGRAGGPTNAVIGAQVAGFNSVTTGIALVGQYQPGASPPAAGVPAEQLNALRALMTWLAGYHGIDGLGMTTATSGCIDENGGACKFPAGTVVSFPTIVAHRDLNNTSCPGQYAVDLIPQLRLDVANAVLRSGPFYPLPDWRPAPSGPKVLVLDVLGGVHPSGAAAATPQPDYWPYFPIARAMAGDASAGYVLDGWGGLHAYGSAPPRYPGSYWPGWDIARGIASGPLPGSGFVLDGWGGVHAFGGAIALGPVAAYWPGWDIARGIVTASGGTGGYVLDGWGGLHQFGNVPAMGTSAYWPGWDIARAIALRPDGPGGYVLDGWGGLHQFGGAPPLNVSRYTPGFDVMRGLVLLPGGGGYVLDNVGQPWPVGTSPPLRASLTWFGFDAGRGIVASPS
jgi:hypothetical protein